jgi:hypothetical protein
VGHKGKNATRTLRAITLALAILAVLAGGRASEASAYEPGTSQDFFGVNAAFLRDFTWPDKRDRLEGLATSMGRQGISWARLTFDQSVEERQRGTFYWYVPDTMIAALARHGVRGAASFVGTATWEADQADLGRCGSLAAPKNRTGWTDWVTAAARRYGPGGSFWAAHPELPNLPIRTWEIGNEVNSGVFWCPAANPEQYADIYGASARAINGVDSTARVMVAGLAPRFGYRTATDLDVPSFLKRMTDADPSLRHSIPAVAIHPYAAGVDQALSVVAKFRLAMVGAGMPNTPMLANEIGWYTRGAASPQLASESQRSSLIAGFANTVWRTNCGVSGLAPYSWITLEQDPGNGEHWYGLADPVTGEPHPSGYAYGQQIQLALGRGAQAPPDKTLRVCHQVPSPPDTRITRVRRNRRRAASFDFVGRRGSGKLTFRCRLDRRPASACRHRVSYRVKPGRHTFKVASTDQLGRTDPTPAVRTLVVRR